MALAQHRNGQVNCHRLSQSTSELMVRQANQERSASADIKPEPGVKHERERGPRSDPSVTIDLEAPPKRLRKASMKKPIILDDSD